MPKNGKPDPLLASLANLKPRVETPEREPSTNSTAAKPRRSVAAKTEELSSSDRLAPTFSVSIYESDFDRMETVRRWLTSHGVRSANKSELLRLGIRLAALSEQNATKLTELFLEMKAQDGRRKSA